MRLRLLRLTPEGLLKTAGARWRSASRSPRASAAGRHAGLRARPGASSRLATIPGTERSPVKTLGRNYLRGLPYAKRHGYTSECAEDASTAAGYLIPPARHVGTGARPVPYGSTCRSFLAQVVQPALEPAGTQPIGGESRLQHSITLSTDQPGVLCGVPRGTGICGLAGRWLHGEGVLTAEGARPWSRGGPRGCGRGVHAADGPPLNQ